MNEEKRFKESELAKREVSTSCSLRALQTHNANTNVSREDHCDIISSISD